MNSSPESKWYIDNAKLPEFVLPNPAVGRFEFWPPVLFYFPFLFWFLWLAIRHRSITAPASTNPSFDLSGLYGESKSQILELAKAHLDEMVPQFLTIHVQDKHRSRAAQRELCQQLEEVGIRYPFVAKPDKGCRGNGVQLIRNEETFNYYLQSFPLGQKLILQKFVTGRGEAGVFYVRKPWEEKGKIISLTLKYFPSVTGDGTRTLSQLLMAHPRVSRIMRLYENRFTGNLQRIIGRNEELPLVFSGSHSKGAVFFNGAAFITDALLKTFDEIASQIPGFYFGRFDVKFDLFDDLRNGENLSILEINGSGAEATHIWDPSTRIFDAWSALAKQYELMWEIGSFNQRQGIKAVPLRKLFREILSTRELAKLYPMTH
jgi:hypothetical protein